jgi:hypothetical protein
MSIRNHLGAILLFIVSLTSARAQSYEEQLTRVRTAIGEKHYPEAASAAEQAIKLDDKRWEAYVLAANAYSSQRLFDDAIGMLQMALPRASEDKKQLIREALADARKQLAGPLIATARLPNPSPSLPTPAPTQAEIVLWKSVEKSAKSDDFKAYLQKYPNGTYSSLAQARIDSITEQEEARRKRITTIAITRWYLPDSQISRLLREGKYEYRKEPPKIPASLTISADGLLVKEDGTGGPGINIPCSSVVSRITFYPAFFVLDRSRIYLTTSRQEIGVAFTASCPEGTEMTLYLVPAVNR